MDCKKTKINIEYENYIKELQNKYGKVPGSYFTNNQNWNKNAKIARGKDGLFVHHAREDRTIMLSTPNYAMNQPWEYQESDQLCYCNYLEHIKLHILIYQHPETWDKDCICGIGGIINLMCREINDFLFVRKRKPYDTQAWRNAVMQPVIDNYDVYTQLLKDTYTEMVKQKESTCDLLKLACTSGFTAPEIFVPELANIIYGNKAKQLQSMHAEIEIIDKLINDIWIKAMTLDKKCEHDPILCKVMGCLGDKSLELILKDLNKKTKLKALIDREFDKHAIKIKD